MNRSTILYLLACLPILAGPLRAEPESYPGGTIRESFHNPGFNSLGNTTQGWDGNPVVAGWETSATNRQITFGWSGAVSAAGMYGYRFDSSGETSPTAGSMGVRTDPVSGPIRFGWGLRNDSGVAIDQFLFRFSAFVANYLGHSTDRLSFSWGIGETLETAVFTEVPEAVYVPPAGSGNGNPVAGTANRYSVEVTGLDWQPGAVLWLRWTDHQDDVNGSIGMGVDHFYFDTPAHRVEAYTPWVFDEAGATEVLHVDRGNPAAADTNPGTEAEPLLTIQGAVLRAKTHASSGKGTRIMVHAGTYREIIDITARAGNRPLIIEGVGEAIISGSDVFASWQASEIPNVYTTAWTYDFGWEPNPWPGDLALKYPQGTRRELLFLNRTPMTQVVTMDELAEGTYLVDEANDLIYFYPPVGVDLNLSTVEVSVRPEALYGENSKLLRVFRVSNVKLKNLIFEHAAAASLANDSAIAFRGCSNVVLEDVVVRYNNGFGASFSDQGDTPAENYYMKNFRSIANGALGMDGGGVSNIRFEGGEVRLANWRGALWGATGWAPCGFKFASYHGMHMSDFVISQNHASGVWMDSDNRDVLFERVYSVNNYRSGFSLEANYGPIILRDCVVFGNSTGINGFDNSGAFLENCFIGENSERQVRFAGSIPLTEEELLEFEAGWSRSRQAARHIPTNWTLDSNVIGSSSNTISDRIFEFGLRTGSYLDEQGQPRYQVFFDTYLGQGNTFSIPGGQGALAFAGITGNRVDFPAWAELSGESAPVWTSTEAFLEALAAAEASVGESATGFSGLESATAIVTVEVAQTAAEDGPVTGQFLIRREGGDLSQPLIVAFALSGSASESVDYAAVVASVYLGPEVTEGVVEIAPVVDGLPEVNETVILQIAADIDGNYRLGNPSIATMTIADADSLIPGQIDHGTSPAAAPVSFALELNNPSTETVTLSFGSFSEDYAVMNSANDPEVAHQWDDIRSVGTPVAFNWISTNNDGVSNALPMGFTFPYFSGQYSEAFVHSNGFLTLEPLANPGYRFTVLKALPEPSDAAAGTMIAGFWSNLALDASSAIHSAALPGRFVVQYTDVYRSGVFGEKQRVTFQIILFASGEIDFVYHSIGYKAPSQSVGIQNADGSAGLSLSFNESNLSAPQTIRLVPPVAWLAVSEPSIVLPGGGSATFSVTLRPLPVSFGAYQHLIDLIDENSGTVLFSLPVSFLVNDAGDVLANAVEFGGGWVISPWMGGLMPEQAPGVYHADGRSSIGWLLFGTTTESGLWYFEVGANRWCWTSQEVYPWVWTHADGWEALW